jgi:hypothetical protein
MKWLCDIPDMKYDINVICCHWWPCDKSSIFARYTHLLRGARPCTGSHVTFLLNLLRLIQSLVMSECPLLILVSMSCKNNCIVFKERPLYISLRLEFCRIVEQEALDGFFIYLRWRKQETQRELWSETPWKIAAFFIGLYNDHMPNGELI